MRRDACTTNRFQTKPIRTQYQSVEGTKNATGSVLSQLLAEFPACLGRPPEPRDKAGPDNADGDGGGTMERDIDDGLVQLLSHVVPIFLHAGTWHMRTRTRTTTMFIERS